MSFLLTLWQSRRYLAMGLITAAFLGLYFGFWMRGVEIARLHAQVALVEQASQLRAVEASRTTKALYEARNANNRSRNAILKGLKPDGTSHTPTVIYDALAGLCQSGAECK